jgi:hypothetical protein
MHAGLVAPRIVSPRAKNYILCTSHLKTQELAAILNPRYVEMVKIEPYRYTRLIANILGEF